MAFAWKCGCRTDPSLCSWRWVGSQPKPINFWLIGARALARETARVTGVECFVSSGSGQKIGSEPVPAFEEILLRNAVRAAELQNKYIKRRWKKVGLGQRDPCWGLKP